MVVGPIRMYPVRLYMLAGLIKVGRPCRCAVCCRVRSDIWSLRALGRASLFVVFGQVCLHLVALVRGYGNRTAGKTSVACRTRSTEWRRMWRSRQWRQSRTIHQRDLTSKRRRFGFRHLLLCLPKRGMARSCVVKSRTSCASLRPGT